MRYNPARLTQKYIYITLLSIYHVLIFSLMHTKYFSMFYNYPPTLAHAQIANSESYLGFLLLVMHVPLVLQLIRGPHTTRSVYPEYNL